MGQENTVNDVMIPAKESEEIDAQIVANRIRYESDAKVRDTADRIHRMKSSELSNWPTCDSCICNAISIMDTKGVEDRND